MVSDWLRVWVVVLWGRDEEAVDGHGLGEERPSIFHGLGEERPSGADCGKAGADRGVDVMDVGAVDAETREMEDEGVVRAVKGEVLILGENSSILALLGGTSGPGVSLPILNQLLDDLFASLGCGAEEVGMTRGASIFGDSGCLGVGIGLGVVFWLS